MGTVELNPHDRVSRGRKSTFQSDGFRATNLKLKLIHSLWYLSVLERVFVSVDGWPKCKCGNWLSKYIYLFNFLYFVIKFIGLNSLCKSSGSSIITNTSDMNFDLSALLANRYVLSWSIWLRGLFHEHTLP